MNIKDNHIGINSHQLLEQSKQDIAKYGLQVIMVSSTSYLPSFAYSIGLWQTYQHPEIICFGFSNDLGHTILNDVAELIKNGERMEAGKNYDNIFEDSKAEFLNVALDNISDYFGTALNYYEGNKFPALQLVWTDHDDKFPWEEGFEEKFRYKQPLLDRNADFKFSEPKNLAVFTTRQWLELRSPILHVIHEENGDWQFLTGDQMSDDARIVALDQLINRDETLNQLFDLNYGEQAERNVAGGSWTKSKIDYNE